jgi:hypothetical protein
MRQIDDNDVHDNPKKITMATPVFSILYTGDKED